MNIVAKIYKGVSLEVTLRFAMPYFIQKIFATI